MDKSLMTVNPRENQIRGSIMLSCVLFVVENLDYRLGIFICCGLILIISLKQNAVVISKWLLLVVLIIFIGFFSSLGSLSSLKGANVLRDFVYFIKPVVWIFFGLQFMASVNLPHNEKVGLMLNTLILYGLYSAIFFLSNIVFSAHQIFSEGSFQLLRTIAVQSDSDLTGVVFVVFLQLIKIPERFFFSRKAEIIFGILLGFQVIFSLSRTIYLVVVLGLFWFGRFKRQKKLMLVRSAFGIGLIAIVFKFLVKSEFGLDFIGKIGNSINEISASDDWNIYNNIVQNWRGYEVAVTKGLLHSFNAIEHLFGKGFGTLIPVNYSELVGVPSSAGGIIIIHNGYYMLLAKVGLVGMLLYVVFLVGPIVWLRKCRDIGAKVLTYVLMVFTINTYTTTGLFKSGFCVTGLFLLGTLFFESVVHRELKGGSNR